MQKSEIVKDWIKRYTGTSADEYGDWILLTNFQNYVEKFAEKYGVVVNGKSGPMTSATNDSGRSFNERNSRASTQHVFVHAMGTT